MKRAIFKVCFFLATMIRLRYDLIYLNTVRQRFDNNINGNAATLTKTFCFVKLSFKRCIWFKNCIWQLSLKLPVCKITNINILRIYAIMLPSRGFSVAHCSETINMKKWQQWEWRYVNVTALENADKTAPMETVQPGGGRAGRAAAASKPHQWKRGLNVYTWHTLKVMNH